LEIKLENEKAFFLLHPLTQVLNFKGVDKLIRKCSLCEFFNQPYNLPKKVAFESEVNRQTSLRKLVVFLRAYGIETSKDTVSRHIRICMGRELKRETLTTSIKDFFKGTIEIKPQECQHEKYAENRTFNMETEEVDCFCSNCGKFLYSFDPEEDRSKFNDSRLYHKLMREREQAQKHGERVP